MTDLPAYFFEHRKGLFLHEASGKSLDIDLDHLPEGQYMQVQDEKAVYLYSVDGRAWIKEGPGVLQVADGLAAGLLARLLKGEAQVTPLSEGLRFIEQCKAASIVAE